MTKFDLLLAETYELIELQKTDQNKINDIRQRIARRKNSRPTREELLSIKAISLSNKYYSDLIAENIRDLLYSYKEKTKFPNK